MKNCENALKTKRAAVVVTIHLNGKKKNLFKGQRDVYSVASYLMVLYHVCRSRCYGFRASLILEVQMGMSNMTSHWGVCGKGIERTPKYTTWSSEFSIGWPS